jgi:hypothetical protein
MGIHGIEQRNIIILIKLVIYGFGWLELDETPADSLSARHKKGPCKGSFLCLVDRED